MAKEPEPQRKSFGQVAYDAYCDSSKWKSKYTGATLPRWELVDFEVKQHWEASAKVVINYFFNSVLKK